MVEENTSSVLSELGLNEYETKAYLAILESGVVVAREISDRSRIPYAKVYQVLDSLINKNLIEGDEGRPKKFYANKPSEALIDRLESLEDEWQLKHEKRKNKVKQIMPELDTLYKQSSRSFEKEEGIFTIVGLSNILSRIAKLKKQTQKQILITSNNKQLIQDKLLRTITKEENLDIYLRTSVEYEDLNERIKTYNVKTHDNSTTLIFDEFAALTIVETQPGKFASGEFMAILNQIPKMIESMIYDFNLFTKEAN